MRQAWRRSAVVAAGLAVWLSAAPSQAVEYRLQVASLYESGFASFLKSSSELYDGAEVVCTLL